MLVSDITLLVLSPGPDQAPNIAHMAQIQHSRPSHTFEVVGTCNLGDIVTASSAHCSIQFPVGEVLILYHYVSLICRIYNSILGCGRLGLCFGRFEQR